MSGHEIAFILIGAFTGIAIGVVAVLVHIRRTFSRGQW